MFLCPISANFFPKKKFCVGVSPVLYLYGRNNIEKVQYLQDILLTREGNNKIGSIDMISHERTVFVFACVSGLPRITSGAAALEIVGTCGLRFKQVNNTIKLRWRT